VRIPGQGTPKLCYARDLDLRVGYRVVVETDYGRFVGRVTMTPRRREPYATPYEISRVASAEDERAEDEHRELGREIRNEAQKLARDYRIGGVSFVGCDVSLDGRYAEVKYVHDDDGRPPDLSAVHEGLEDRYTARVELRRFTFFERAGETGGCDTCGVPLCCAVWSGARSLGPVNVRIAKQQGVTPNDKVHGTCGEVKCCMRYEHDTYKEFKERAPFKNTVVKLEGREGKVVDYSMVKDSVLVQFGTKRSERELVPLGRLAPENPDVQPAYPEEWTSTGEPVDADPPNGDLSGADPTEEGAGDGDPSPG
jgi:cell fate regulator YaaT (PSP1 superfamily)